MHEHEAAAAPADRESILIELYRQMNELGQQLMLVMAHTIAGNPNLNKSAKKQ